MYEERFWDLMSPKWVKKERKCPRCKKMKVSLNAGDRYCAQCGITVRNVGALGAHSL